MQTMLCVSVADYYPCIIIFAASTVSNQKAISKAVTRVAVVLLAVAGVYWIIQTPPSHREVRNNYDCLKTTIISCIFSRYYQVGPILHACLVLSFVSDRGFVVPLVWWCIGMRACIVSPDVSVCMFDFSIFCQPHSFSNDFDRGYTPSPSLCPPV